MLTETKMITTNPNSIKPEEANHEIVSNRYKVRGILGRGTWGTVYRAHDELLGIDMALKKLTPSELAEAQLQHRNLTYIEVMMKEAGFKAARHVLPRMYEMDENGEPFIIMPICPGTLASVLGEDRPRGSRNSIKLGYPTKERGFRYMTDILTGLEELHLIYYKTYGDWKPENIMIDEHDRAILIDLGTSSFLSTNSTSPRDNMGHLQTRAKELFELGSHPTISSDGFGASAILYRIHFGEYPLETEFNLPEGISSVEAEKKIREFYESKQTGEINNILWKKLKKQTEKPFREFYMNGLNADPKRRTSSAEVLRKELERAILDTSPEYVARQAIRNYAAGVLAPLFLAGVLVVGGVIKRNMPDQPPQKPSLYGPMYLSTNTSETALSVIEPPTGFPRVLTLQYAQVQNPAH